jgi:streptogramin lyase
MKIPLRTVIAVGLGICMPLHPGDGQDATKNPRTRSAPRPGVSTPGVKRGINAITPAAVFRVPGTPVWQVVTAAAIWVSNGPKNSIHRLDPGTNTVVAAVEVGKLPCSGLAAGFGSIWVPVCGDKALVRVDEKTNQVSAKIPLGPASSEGGVAASPDAIWMLTDPKGTLSRIDPATNQVAAKIEVAPGSVACVYGVGSIWVSSPEKNVVTRVDAKTNKVLDTIAVGPKPRFLAYGAGGIWTLNQGDGTISHVDVKTGKLVATIDVGLPGSGGELAFGYGYIWASVLQIPLSKIDPYTDQVVKQWTGPGGATVRLGHGSLWLSNFREQTVWRVDLRQL